MKMGGIMASPELIFFAIKAGVRIGVEARNAYIKNTKQREILLPLPNIDLSPHRNMVKRFFDNDGAEFLQPESEISVLHSRVDELDPDSVEEKRYFELYKKYVAIRNARDLGQESITLAGSGQMALDAYMSLTALEQWAPGDPNKPRPIRRMAGTIIELGIDYFASMPGAINDDSKHAKTLKSFVKGLDKIQFSDVLDQENPYPDLAASIFIAAMETLAEQPEFVTSDPNFQELVTVASAGLATDVTTRLEKLGDEAQKDRLRDWGNLVFRSLLTNAGRNVISDPQKFLGVEDEAEASLVAKVGTSILDLAVTADDMDLHRVFGREGLDVIVKASLSAVADHPELVSDTKNSAVTALIKDVAGNISSMPTVLCSDAVPEIFRITLEKTGDNLEMFWPELRPEKHLLLTAAKTVLSRVSETPPAGAKWKLAFRSDDVLAVVNSALEELVNNPEWLLKSAADQDANLAVVLDATLMVLRRHTDNRLSLPVAREIVVESLRAVSQRKEFLNEVVGAQPVVATVIEIVVGAAFGEENDAARWQLLRSQALTAAISISLDRFAESAMDEACLENLKTVLTNTVADAAEGNPIVWDDFELQLETALAA